MRTIQPYVRFRLTLLIKIFVCTVCSTHHYGTITLFITYERPIPFTSIGP